jgi:hypothetical protein
MRFPPHHFFAYEKSGNFFFYFSIFGGSIFGGGLNKYPCPPKQKAKQKAKSKKNAVARNSADRDPAAKAAFRQADRRDRRGSARP